MLTRKQIENYLENELAFRDYEFKAVSQWRHLNVARTINLLTPTKSELEDAVSTFVRDGYGTILIYVDASKTSKAPKAGKPKRIKKVFSSSSQVYHLWGNQSQSDARQGGRSRAYFEGVHAYSYGSHYEVGRIVTYKGIQVGLVNDTGYSNTTSKHIREAWDALENVMPRVRVQSVFDVRKGLVSMQDKLVSQLFDLFNRRAFWSGCKYGRKDRLFEEVTEFNKTCKALGHSELTLDVPDEYIDLLNAHVKACIARTEELKGPEFQAKREAARERKAANEALKNADAIQAWRRGAPANSFIRAMRPQILRIASVGNETLVETSGGAEVPLADAKRLLNKILDRTAKQGDKVGSFEYGGLCDGIVEVGCHHISIEEAKTVLARHLKAA